MITSSVKSNCSCPNNLYTSSRDDLLSLNSNLFTKLKNDLKNKYKKMIYEKKYDINNYDKDLKKIIDNYNYLNYLNYPMLLQTAERDFLKKLSNYIDKKTHLLNKENVKAIIDVPDYFLYEREKLKEEIPKKPKKVNLYNLKSNDPELKIIKEERRINQKKLAEEREIRFEKKNDKINKKENKK